MRNELEFAAALEFAENPEPRLPCVLVLDVSTSMRGQRIKQLNEGIVTYAQSLAADSIAAKRVEVAVVSFATEVKLVVDFTISARFEPPTLVAKGWTHMGQGMRRALSLVENRKWAYKNAGVPYFRPWIFLITDGGPNDPGWEAVAEASRAGDAQNSFSVFCVGVEGANFRKLAKFSNRDPLRLQGLRFRDLFLWLSRSQRAVSSSAPGQEIALANPVGPTGWATIANTND